MHRFPIGGDCSDDMADPAQKAARADPKTGGDDQPENAPPEMAIIELPHTGNQETQHRGISGTCHAKSFFSRLWVLIFIRALESSEIGANLSELIVPIKFFNRRCPFETFYAEGIDSKKVVLDFRYPRG
jgi:hypothetical protein